MGALLLLLALDAGGKVPFGKDYEAGLARAKERGVPVLLYFWCDWSPYCAELDRGALSEDPVVAAAAEFVPVLVDVSKDPLKLRDRFRIRFAPTLLVVSAEGKSLLEHKETWETERVLKTLRLAARRFGRAFWSPGVKAALEAAKKDRRPVLVFRPRRDEKVDPPEKYLRSALGDFAWKFLYAVGEPADEPAFELLDSADGRRLAQFPTGIKEEDFRRELEEAYRAWKNP